MGRLFKWMALGVGALLALAVTSALCLRAYYTDARLSLLVREQLRARLATEVRLGSVELHLLHGIILTDVVIGPPRAPYREDIAQIREIRLGYRLLPLLARKVAIDSIAIVAPDIVLEMPAGETWNVLALAHALSPGEPKPEASSAPQALGFEIDLASFTLRELRARVLSAEMNASVEHVQADVSGVYTGDTARARVTLLIGTENRPADVRFASRDLGEAQLSLFVQAELEARSLSEASVSLSVAIAQMQGQIAGYVLPELPLALRLEADANVLTQKANLMALQLSLGSALRLDLAAHASEIMGDAELSLERCELGLRLHELLATRSAAHLPLRARGEIALTKTRLHARLSALKQLTPFRAESELVLRDVELAHADRNIRGASGSARLELDPQAGLRANLRLDIAHGQQAESGVGSAQLTLAASAPAQILRRELPSPLHVGLEVHAESITPAAEVLLRGARLGAQLDVFDLQGARTDVDLEASVAQVETHGAGLPLALSLRASRRAPKLEIGKLSLTLADVVRLTASGAVIERPAGALDLDLDATLADVDLAKLVQAAPPEQRKALGELALSGTLGMNAEIKGRLPADFSARLRQPLDAVLDQGTPFDLDLQLGWQNIAVAEVLFGASGALSLQTRPQRESLQLDAQLARFDGADTHIGDASFTVDAQYAKSEATAVGHLHAGSIASASTKTLLGTALDFELGYTRGVELLLKRVAVSVPTLGANIAVRARLEAPEEALAARAWQSPTLLGLKADAALEIDIALPEKRMTLLPDNPLALSGGIGFKLGVGLDASQMKVEGAMRATHLDVQSSDLRVANMHGMFPFVQELRWTSAGIKPVLSTDDILRDKPRIAYYSDLRSYGRDENGLRIDHVAFGRNQLDKLALNGKLDRGKLLLDYFSASFLSGDLEGQLAAQLGADKVFRLALGAKFSDLDLSVLSKTTPGPESQINGNMQLQIAWGEKYPRELDQTTFNITRVGSNMLGALILGLDPEAKNESLVNTRKQVKAYQANINLLQVSVFHNTANIDIDTRTFLSFVGINLIDRAAARRLDIKPRLEAALAPLLDPLLGPLLGWTDTNP